MPSTLVAQLLGVREFGFGSTLAFRADDLAAAGGFAAIADYLADDYQLANQISKLGRRALLSTYTVETSLGESTWAGVWNHQLRWARTIRASKGAGYAGLPITHAGLWAAAALGCGAFVRGSPAARLSHRVRHGDRLVRTAAPKRPESSLGWLQSGTFTRLRSGLASYASNRVRWRDRVVDNRSGWEDPRIELPGRMLG